MIKPQTVADNEFRPISAYVGASGNQRRNLKRISHEARKVSAANVYSTANLRKDFDYNTPKKELTKNKFGSLKSEKSSPRSRNGSNFAKNAFRQTSIE